MTESRKEQLTKHLNSLRVFDIPELERWSDIITKVHAVVDAAREQVAQCSCRDGVMYRDYYGKATELRCWKCIRLRKPLADLDAADG